MFRDALIGHLDRLDTWMGSVRRRIGIVAVALIVALIASLLGRWLTGGQGVTGVAYVVWLAMAATVAMRCARVRWPSVALVVAGIALYGFYLSKTPFDVRNYDAPAHLKYVEYVLRNRALPSVETCTICQHPPAYHILAALVMGGAEKIGLADPIKAVQGFSLLLWVTFVSLSAYTLYRLARRPYQQYLATALVVFWPYSIINSVRLSNDILVYAIAAGVIACLVDWFARPRARFLWIASALTLLGLLTKATALSLVALIFVVVAARLALDLRRRAWLRSQLPALAALVVAVALLAGVRASGGNGLVKNTLGSAWRTLGFDVAIRTPRFYLTFNVPSQFQRPYAEVRLGIGEPTYWNHLLKSSLYGTKQGWGTTGTLEPSAKIARGLNWLLPALSGVIALGLLLSYRAGRRRRVLCIAMVGSFVAIGLAFHLTVPASHHADFRFILPVIVPMSLLYVYAVERILRTTKWGGYVAALLACVFLTLSVYSFVRMSAKPPDAPSDTGLNRQFRFIPLPMPRGK